MIYKSNLLSHHWQRRMLTVRCLRFWCAAWAIAGLIAVLACAGKYSLHGNRVTSLDKLNARATPLYNIVLETTKCKRELARLEGRESLLATLDSSNQPFQLMGVISQSVAYAGDISIEKFDLQTVNKDKNTTQNNSNPLLTRKRRIKAKPTNQAPQEEQVELTLRGTSANDVAIAQFVSELRKYEIFDSVVLHSSHAEVKDGEKQFHVGCKYSK